MRVGCPIRRSRDQRSLASPPGFSQRATSFIASQCQGIHQMPFIRASCATPNGKDHLCSKGAALGVGSRKRLSRPAEHRSAGANSPLRRHYGIPPTTRQAHTPRSRPRSPASVTQLASSPCAINNSRPGIPEGSAGDKFGSAAAFFKGGAPDAGLSAFAAQTPVALAETCGFVGGGGERARTVDLLLAKQALSQLSYTPMPEDQNAELPFLAFCRLFI